MLHIVASHQPHFDFYFGYLGKILHADTFIFSDNVQFTKRNFQHRNRIRTAVGPNGWRWLTVPVRYSSTSKISEVALASNDHDDWRNTHLNVLENEYHRAPYFSQTMSILEAEIYSANGAKTLAQMNEIFVRRFAYEFGLKNERKYVLASQLDIDPPTDKTDRLIKMTKAVGGNAYLAGRGALNYLNPAQFEEAGVTLLIQDMRHPSYAQVHGGQFIQNLGVIDLLMNLGPRKAQEMMTNEHFSYHTA